MKRSISPQEISEALESLLARPPSVAGKRLRSERELAALIGIDRMKVQKAFDLLVAKGILLRRHGSGTYVRKVPKVDGTPLATKVGTYPLAAEELFARVTERPMRWNIDQQRCLKLAVLPNLEWQSDSNRAILNGIKDRARQEGHELKCVNFELPADAAAAAKFITKLKRSLYDGYVLWTPYAPLFAQAFGEDSPPVVYIGAGERDADLLYSPLVRVNLEDATVRALRILHGEGYQRIGLIGFHGFERSFEKERELYEETMGKLGMDFRASAFCPLEQKAVEAKVRRMFSSTPRPDAVYVADDVVLRHVAPVWQKMGISPGENLGVITLATDGAPLPAGQHWSRMEFTPYQVGRMAMDSLLQEISTVGKTMCSFEHLAIWRKGETHMLRPTAGESKAGRGEPELHS